MIDLLDETMLDELRDIMEDEFPSLLATFLAESERQYMQVRQAQSAGNFDELRRAAHALKGSCGNVGALSLHETCAELEYKAKESDPEGMEDLVVMTGQQLAEVSEAVRALC